MAKVHSWRTSCTTKYAWYVAVRQWHNKQEHCHCLIKSKPGETVGCQRTINFLRQCTKKKKKKVNKSTYMSGQSAVDKDFVCE